MIKAGIIGGSNPMAGELIRLLINHPDVEIIWVDSARFTGRLVSDVHHGLLGETELRISPSSSNMLDEINALFIFRHKGQTVEWLSSHQIPDELRIIDLSVDMRDPDLAHEFDFTFGLPELNRKEMVRGSKRAIVPHPAAIIAATPLLPAAKACAISSDVEAIVSMPGLGEQMDDPAEINNEVEMAIRLLQPEYAHKAYVNAAKSDDERVMSATIEFDTTLDIGELLRIYDEFFDDHNFVFAINSEPEAKEVAGTNKLLMSIDKHGPRVTITAAMDALIKGAAGTAVHDMNLLFGLHEKVGLALKASKF